MSIIIKGMEMPHDCDECKLCAFIPVGDYGINRKCMPLNRKAEISIRRSDCPLVPVPPHGRLVNADDVMDAVDLSDFIRDSLDENGECLLFEDSLLERLAEIPTIIEAEGET